MNTVNLFFIIVTTLIVAYLVGYYAENYTSLPKFRAIARHLQFKQV